MGRLIGLALACTLAIAPTAEAQARRPQAARAAPPRAEPVDVSCPTTLGTGVTSGRVFCDVLSGRDPAGGVIVKLPPRQGPATLSFDLHARHTYSAELEREGRAYARYTATIGVLTMDNTLISRAVVRAVFRHASDLFDRVAVEEGSDLLKAVAPIGQEPIRIVIPPDVDAVSLLGERVSYHRIDGEMITSAVGSPIAVVSELSVEYVPAPAAKPAPARRRR